MINSYIALDLETTGLNPADDRIIEIGMVRVIDGQITDSYSELINPGRKLTDRVIKLTGISNEMLEGKPHIDEIIEDIFEFIGDMPILGHNITFDYSFLKKAAVNNNMKFDKSGIDTLKIARRILLDVPHKNLDYLCEYFGINPGNSHRAYDDAVSAKKLYECLYKIKPEDDLFINAVQLNYNVKKDSPITEAQKNYLCKLTAFYDISLEEDIEQLTKSRASKIIDGIISEYGKMPYQR